MAYTNFIGDGVSVNGAPLIPGGGTVPFATQYFFVNSVSGSNGNTGSSDNPFGTIDYAVGMCTASKGNTIVVLPGHVETVTAAAGLAIDVAGINIVGIGQGSLRPTINFTTAVGASMRVSVANCTMNNFLFTGGIDALTNPIDIRGADFTLANCTFRDVTGQATDAILTTAAANRLKILNHRHEGAAAAGANSAIAIVGGDGIIIDGLYMDGNFAVGGIDVRTTATTNIVVKNMTARTQNAADVIMVDTITGSTGFIGPNIVMRLQDNAANFAGSIAGATFVYAQPIGIVNNAGELTNIDPANGFKTASTNA